MKDPYVKATVASIGESAMTKEQSTYVHIEIDHNLVELLRDDNGNEIISMKLRCNPVDINFTPISKRLREFLPNRVVDTILEDIEDTIYKASVMEKLKTMIR